VFAASAAALVLASGIGVLAGSFLSAHVDARAIRWVAGLGFVVVGIWVLLGRNS
jgi:putative Ca2+/H+ antiporter (TMEM165/GDT1 family)